MSNSQELLNSFINKAEIMYGNKFDYSTIKIGDIRVSKSKVFIICNECGYHWGIIVRVFLSDVKQCPRCTGRAPWDLEGFIWRARKLYGDKYNYDKISKTDIHGKFSCISISCNDCSYEWLTTIASHINNKVGCRQCAGHTIWSTRIFLEKAIEIHGDKYRYTNIYGKDLSEGDIKNTQSYINIYCNVCSYGWESIVYRHIINKSGCGKCGHTLRWTLSRFIQEAFTIHGDKYDYSKIKEEDVINSTKSYLPITCKTCGYNWKSTIINHIKSKSGCVKCINRLSWNLPRFLEEAHKIHESSKYDYSDIQEGDISTIKSHINIFCRKCDKMWTTTVANHIHKKSGCINCCTNSKITLKKFLLKAKEIHGDDYDYSQIKPEDVVSSKSIVKIKCKKCGHTKDQLISSHIYRKTSCVKCKTWTYEKFIKKASGIHGEKYDYSNIKSGDIVTSISVIQLVCKDCNYHWSSTLYNHIKGNGCPNCSGKIPWDLQRFIEKARNIHGNKFNYDMITPDMIRGQKSHIPITCNDCGYIWDTSTISSHINQQSGCASCSKNLPWTLQRFIEKSKQIHGDRYDYSKITDSDIKGAQSKVTLICRKCNRDCAPSINHHINHKSGCTKCNKSRGETNCYKFFDDNKIEYLTEFILNNLPKKRFDIMFNYNKRKYLLEFDGIQHFKFINYFYNNEEDFLQRQKVDILKTQKGLDEGYNIIRIDYTNIDNIPNHIQLALDKEEKIYVSDCEMYTYILDNIKIPYKIKIVRNG